MSRSVAMRIADAAGWFESQRLEDGVTLIDEPHVKPYDRCNSWHVRGRDRRPGCPA